MTCYYSNSMTLHLTYVGKNKLLQHSMPSVFQHTNGYVVSFILSCISKDCKLDKKTASCKYAGFVLHCLSQEGFPQYLPIQTDQSQCSNYLLSMVLADRKACNTNHQACSFNVLTSFIQCLALQLGHIEGRVQNF